MDAQLLNVLELNGDVSIPEKYIGPQGYSAYELAVKQGFEGTIDEWLESLHGEVTFADLTDTQKESLRGPAGKDGRDGEDAIAAINPRGNFTNGETYNKNDYVTAEDGNTYTCMIDGVTTSPLVTPEAWQLIALRGATGEKGADGLDGLPGVNGLSNYQIAVKNGFEGTEEEWLETLKSTIPGPQGEPFTYEDFTEEQLEALRGPAGKDGEDGEPGKDGAPGEKGTTWFTGTQDPNEHPDPNQTPKLNDIFLNTTNGDVFKYNGTSWVLGANFKGPKGDKGEDSTVPGPAGPAGADGANGSDYVITAADYDAIADVVLGKLENADEVSF